MWCSHRLKSDNNAKCGGWELDLSSEFISFSWKFGISRKPAGKLTCSFQKARYEKRALIERNNSLRERVAAVTASQKMINYQMKILGGVVNNFSQDSKFHIIVAELDNNQDFGDIEELKALVDI